MRRIDKILRNANASEREKRLIRSYIQEGINTCTVGMANMRKGPLYDSVAYRKLAEDRQGLQKLMADEAATEEETLFD